MRHELSIATGERVELPDEPTTQSLDGLKTAQTAVIDSSYDLAITANIDYLGFTFQADYPTHDNLKSVLSCGSVPDGFAWFDINNNPVPMSYQQVQEFSKALVYRGFSAFVKKQTLKNQILAAIDAATVQAIVW